MENILFDFILKYISLSEDEKSAMVSLNIFHTFKKGTVLLREWEHSVNGYFVLKGCIRTFYIIDGEEKTTEFYSEMEGITPGCVISKLPSDYFISCVEDSIIVVSNPDMEVEIFQKFPKFETLCRVLSEQRLAKKQSSFDDFKTSSPEKIFKYSAKQTRIITASSATSISELFRYYSTVTKQVKRKDFSKTEGISFVT